LLGFVVEQVSDRANARDVRDVTATIGTRTAFFASEQLFGSQGVFMSRFFSAAHLTRTCPPYPIEREPDYAFDGWAAVRAATFAAIAITVYMLTIPRALGIEQMDIGITVAEMVGNDGSPAMSATRVAWHVVNGLVYVFAYALALAHFGKQSTAATGVLFGLTLWAIGPMSTVPLALDWHPAVASGALVNPGIFMQSLGLGWEPPAVDLGAHLCHGVIAGVAYKHRVR
jgi:hypothetical protein